MWYTHYKTIKTDRTDLLNDFYRDILSLIKIQDWRNLLEIYNSDRDLEWEAEEYFHEYSRDDNENITIANKDWRWFCKTARKMYDIAVLLSYAFDDYLCWIDEISWDYRTETEKFIKQIVEGMRVKDLYEIKFWLLEYIENELDNDYDIKDINNICEKIIKYCDENEVEEID